PEEFPAGLEKQIVVEQAVVEQRTCLFPVTDHHTGIGALLRSHRGDALRILDSIYLVVLEKPVTRLAQLGLASLIVNLQVELGLFIRRCAHAAYLLRNLGRSDYKRVSRWNTGYIVVLPIDVPGHSKRHPR